MSGTCWYKITGKFPFFRKGEHKQVSKTSYRSYIFHPPPSRKTLNSTGCFQKGDTFQQLQGVSNSLPFLKNLFFSRYWLYF